MIARLFKVRKKPGEIYLRWPFRITWKRDTAESFFDWHAVQDRGDTFYQYYHIGSILIKLGKRSGFYNKDGYFIKETR
jgi:hypothetical protein